MGLSFWEPSRPWALPRVLQLQPESEPHVGSDFGAGREHAAVCSQRMRAALSSSPSAAALLQRGLPKGGAEMVALEGATEIPRHGSREREAKRAEPTLQGACQKSQSISERGG